MQPIIINLIGGPCVGKSTTAAGLYHMLSTCGYVVEMCNEYAKRLIWEGNVDMINDQFYLSTRQYKLLKALRDQPTIDFVITDGPLVHGLYYNRFNKDNVSNRELTHTKIIEYHREFRNLNIHLKRDDAIKYITAGRIHTEDEAKHCDAMITQMMLSEDIPFTSVKPTDIKYIAKIVIDHHRALKGLTA